MSLRAASRRAPHPAIAPIGRNRRMMSSRPSGASGASGAWNGSSDDGGGSP
jgi:hypothetical protein